MKAKTGDRIADCLSPIPLCFPLHPLRSWRETFSYICIASAFLNDFFPQGRHRQELYL